MPLRDGTGPAGKGPRTGRGAGPCTLDGKPVKKTVKNTRPRLGRQGRPRLGLARRPRRGRGGR